MPSMANSQFDALKLMAELKVHDRDSGLSICWMFKGLSIYIDRPQHASTDTLNGEAPGPMAALDLRLHMASNTARFAGAQLAEDIKDENITHVAVGDNRSRLRGIRATMSRCYPRPSLSISRRRADGFTQAEAITSDCHRRVDRAELGGEDTSGRRTWVKSLDSAALAFVVANLVPAGFSPA